jgi:hypothetical protein
VKLTLDEARAALGAEGATLSDLEVQREQEAAELLADLFDRVVSREVEERRAKRRRFRIVRTDEAA